MINQILKLNPKLLNDDPSSTYSCRMYTRLTTGRDVNNIMLIL